jgi:hypothetical protein
MAAKIARRIDVNKILKNLSMKNIAQKSNIPPLLNMFPPPPFYDMMYF